MKKIIIPTDFSANAQKAIDYALLLFKNETCTFYILHAYHDAPSAPGSKMTFQEELNKLVKVLQAQNTTYNHRFEAILETDSVFSLTKRTVFSEKADYIFVGTKGLSSLREAFIGTNTLQLIRDITNCPIISVPSVYTINSLKEIVFATDFKHTFKTEELAPIVQMALICNADLNIAHIKTEENLSDEQKINKEVLRNGLKGVKGHFFEIDLQDSVANTLVQIKKTNQNVGMLSILKTKHGFFQTLTRENIVKSIAFKTEVPFMVLPQIE
ncbi:universal stress protein [Zobellia nedashkovskayae]|uniref:universal stress protein n=1 Tax=Zobellia nedashkovskayae TaxID=2779510 RepID=UPI00188BF4CF|nr:universal stress protein [Zobellia nedashkovskayae]